MADASYQRAAQPLLIVLSGTAGSGKDSVLRRMKERGVPFHFVVTATSRPPRPGEVDGKDYFFLSEAAFREMIAKNELLEHALVYDQHKGVPKQQVRDAMASGRDVVMRVDVQGAATIRAQCPEAVLVFLTAGTEAELAGRLAARQTDTPEQIALRVAAARAEMQRIPEFDYMVVNADGRLDEAVDTILAILCAEHARSVPRKAAL
jgi:guanylate kinase